MDSWKLRMFGQLMKKDGDKPAGGGGGKGNQSQDDSDGDDSDDSQDDDDSDDGEHVNNKSIKELMLQNKKLMQRLEKLETRGQKDPDDNSNLAVRANRKIKDEDEAAGNAKALEAAIAFRMGAKDWVKNNEGLLPKSIPSIFEMADKETYDSPIEKDSVLKMNIVQEFFSIEANVKLLTQSQKGIVEDYLKRTKTVKQERAQSIYETIFEPTLETLRHIKKAEQLNSGVKNQTDGEKALAEKWMKRSKQHYLGDKENA